jgi:16S rRNA (cytidine1402-2'-O)-methyltransferase
MKQGTLYLIPSPLGAEDVNGRTSPETLSIINGLRYFFAEDLRSCRRALRAMGFVVDFNEVHFCHIGKHSNHGEAEAFIQHLKQGRDVGLMSEVGMPAVADPGSMVVMLAHQLLIEVKPLLGASSLLMGLMASGLNGQKFAFEGYLPLDKKERQQKLRELCERAKKYRQTQLFIETPFRNSALFKDITDSCPEDIYLSIAMDIHGIQESFATKKIGSWKKFPPSLGKLPAVFILGYL